MKEIDDLSLKLIEMLAVQNPTPEQKKVQALIKAALLSKNLLAFINEVDRALAGFGPVNRETVKGVIEYARAHNEAQIRNLNLADDEIERLVEKENNSLTEVEVWILGTLAYLGVLK